MLREACGKFGWLIRLFLASLPATTALVGQTSLTATPQRVSLAAPAGSTTPAVQPVALSSGTQGAAYDAAVRYLSPATGWLSVAPASGTVPATLMISADATDLSAGTYLAQITISAGPQHVGTYVDVFFTVGPGSGASTLAVDQTGLTFLGFSTGDILPAQTLSVTNAAGATDPLAFTAYATSSGNWLLVSPNSGSTPATLTVSAIQGSLPAGNYNGTITITPVAGGAPVVVPVTLAAAGDTAVPPALLLSQSLVTINYQAGTPAPASQGVFLDVTQSSMNYTASTATPWISLSTEDNPVPAAAVTGLAPGILTIVINPAGLPFGKHLGTIDIVSTGLPPQQLPVSLTVTNAPALNADPSSLSFTYANGVDLTGEQTVTVTSTGSTALSFTAIASTTAGTGPWLSVTPGAASTSGGSTDLTVTTNASTLAAGTYRGAISLAVAGSSATFTIPVVLNASGSAGETLEVPTDTVQLLGIAGGAAPSRQVNIGRFGTTHNFTAAASSTGGWLMVAPFSGTTPAALTISANPTAVTGPGDYDGSVVVTALDTGQQDTIPVTFTLAEKAIVADPAQLSFTQDKKGAVPSPQTVQITGNVPSTFTVGGASSWITISPASGQTPSQLTVTVDPTGLPPGAASGSFQITGPDNQLTIPVSFTVAEAPQAAPTPASLSFSYQLGSPPPEAQMIAVASTGDPVSFTVAATTDTGVSWLNVSPASGSTPATLTVTLDPAKLVPGTQSGSIAITTPDDTGGAGTTASVAVTVQVAPSPAPVQALLNAATLAPTAVAPGQIITITGAGLGPLTGVTAQPSAAGAFDTVLSGVRVLFDSIAAPLLFVRSDQINAIVPYAVYGRTTTRLQVQNGDAYSVPVEVKVVDSAPGIFTIGSSGRGHAAALNEAFTPNSPEAPAARGSIISVFGTGEGQTDPPGQDGRVIANDLRRPVLPVRAKIAGRDAEVTYIGSAPGMVSGVFQANIRIPEETEPGEVLLEVRVGDAVTQSGVTVSVR